MEYTKEQKKDKKELTDFIQHCLDNGSTAPVIRQGVVEILNRHNSPANSRKISDVSFIASQINNNKTKVSFFTHKAGRGGWSEWVYPTKKYLFKCCDCNLVHEFQFGTLRINKKTHTLLRQKALDNEITVIKLLDKILKSYYKINK